MATLWGLEGWEFIHGINWYDIPMQKHREPVQDRSILRGFQAFGKNCVYRNKTSNRCKKPKTKSMCYPKKHSPHFPQRRENYLFSKRNN
jgi:hypothetical protein